MKDCMLPCMWLSSDFLDVDSIILHGGARCLDASRIDGGAVDSTMYAACAERRWWTLIVGGGYS